MAIDPHNRYLRKLRDITVAHLLFKRLVVTNLDPGEVGVEPREGGFELRIRDGARLLSTSTPDPALRGALRSICPIPDGAEMAISDYILRYKFPHFDPSRRPRSPAPIRFALELAMHLQHRNTFWSLSPRERARLTDVFALREGDRVLEAGPYLGFGTVQMSRLVGRSGRIVALEAGRDTHRVLLENLARNAAANVAAHHAALGPSDGEMLIAEECDQRISLVQGVVKETAARPVVTRSLESICRQEGLDPSFIILTINGAELMAIDGSVEFLRQCANLRLIAPGWYRDREGAIGPRMAARLRGLGFEVVTTRDHLVFAYK